jgi:hypothetical protein
MSATPPAFLVVSSSVIFARRARRWSSCWRCGSTLGPRHLEQRQQGLQIFRCPCGRRRHIRREVAAG